VEIFIMSVLLALYLSGAATYFAIAFRAFKQDTELSPSELRLSWIVLAVATAIWPVFVPLSCIELALKYQAAENQKCHTHLT
jgi:heme/copper-type cytochrome/quinol oxidase subunit 2